MKRRILLSLVAFLLTASPVAFADASSDFYSEGESSELKSDFDVEQFASDEAVAQADNYERRGERDRSRYEWVFSYVDRKGECNSCDFSCRAPRCDSNTVGLTKACKIPGTHDDHNVYRCTEFRRR